MGPADSIDPSSLDPAVQVIQRRTGLTSGPLRADLKRILARRADEGPDDLAVRLEQASVTGELWQEILQELAIGETYFLRDQEHFQLLRTHILPDLLKQRETQQQRTIRVWCAGCATGEEAYSVAITLLEEHPAGQHWQFHITGTDLNQRAIETARRAIYREWSFRHAEHIRDAYFEPVDGGSRVLPRLQQCVTFQAHNLVDGSPGTQFDIVLCRNVMLYMDRETIEQVEDTLYHSLRPGGWLLLGRAEALHTRRDRWLMHVFPGAPMYQRPQPSSMLAGGQIRYQHGLKTTSSKKSQSADDPLQHPDFQQAVQAIHEGAYARAEQHLANVLGKHPRHVRSHALLAFLFASRRATPEARAHLDAALRQQPLLANGHYIRAVIYLEYGDTARAISALQAVLYCDRDHILGGLLLGNLYQQKGEHDRAQRTWQQALQAAKRLPAAHHFSDFSELTAGAAVVLLQDSLDHLGDG